MTRAEIYEELAKVSDSKYVIVNDEFIIETKDLNDDTLGLVEYDDDEETTETYSFSKVDYIVEVGANVDRIKSLFDVEGNYFYYEDEDYIYRCDFKPILGWGYDKYPIIEKKEK